MIKRILKGAWINIKRGDKVIWIVTILLILFSMVACFSATTMNIAPGEDITVKFVEQMKFVMIGLGVIIFCCLIPSVAFFKWCSKWGFLVSAVCLLLLFSPLGQNINGEVRAIRVFGFSVAVYEVVKVAMIMYLSWAVQAYRNGEFELLDKLSAGFPVLGRPFVQRSIYLYIPIAVVCILTLVGSFSSTVILFGILIATLYFNQLEIPFGKILLIIVAFAGLGALAYCSYKVSDGRVFGRFETVEQRMARAFETDRVLLTTDENGQRIYRPGTAAFRQKVDKLMQPVGSRIAIKEGGILGKMPGRSTQKYRVPLMFSDFMFAFILEEYGLWGGVLIIILYVSLLARGSIIARNCDDEFTKGAIASLVTLISAQAMIHMYINVGMFPLTGQNLPMVSLGGSSFIMFSLAFGVILSLSSVVKKKMEQEEKRARIVVPDGDELAGRMDELDQFGSDPDGMMDLDNEEFDNDML